MNVIRCYFQLWNVFFPQFCFQPEKKPSLQNEKENFCEQINPDPPEKNS